MDDFIAPATYVQPIPTIQQAANLEKYDWSREIDMPPKKEPRYNVSKIVQKGG